MKVQALRGFRDYLPEEMLLKARFLERVAGVFESFGYPPLQTPALEYSEILLGKYGEEGDMLMYRFRDNGDRDVCLRYDLTVPLARVMAEHGELPIPFRRYQIAPVWRAEKPAKGRYREFMQCDVDLVGVDDASADAEMLEVGAAVLAALDVERYEIRVNHRGILRGLTRGLGVEDGEREGAFLRWLDKLEKIGEEKFIAGVREEFGFDDATLERLTGALASDGDSEARLAALETIVGEDPAGADGVARLRELFPLLERVGIAAKVTFDARIARGLSYYTGLIYETTLLDLPSIGSVMSGGRYNDLVGMFSKRDLPSIGISLGVDRLFAALRELRDEPATLSPAQVMVVRFSAEQAADTHEFAARTRAAGLAAMIYPGEAKLKKQMQYANKLGVPFTAILGADEVAAREVTVKEMESGEQRRLSWDDAIAWIRSTTSESAGAS